MILVFEGMDRVGKTSTIQKLNQFTDYKYPTIDRGPAGFIAYDDLLHRTTPERLAQNMRDAATLSQGDVIFIYLFATPSVIERRLAEEGATLPAGTSIKTTLQVYGRTVDQFYPKHKVWKYNTSHNSTEWIVRDILNRIDEMHTYWPIDLHVKHSDPDTDKIYFHPSHNVIPEELFNFLDEFNGDCDPAYYDMLYTTLDHTMFKYETGWINERQLVVSSNECIPCVQIIITDKQFIMDVKQRSLNIRKHSCQDLCFFRHWYRTSAFCQKYIDQGLDFVVNYDIAFPHSFPF